MARGKKKEKELTPEEKLQQALVSVEEQPYQVPENWLWVRLSAVFEINPKNYAPDSVDAAFVPMEKISAGMKGTFDFIIQPWGKAKKGHTQFADGDIAFAKISPCFENGKSMIVQGLPNGIGGGTTELIVLRQPLMNQDYTFRFVSNERFIRGGCQTYSGTVGQQRISMDYVRQCPFPLPPFPEQHRIVDRIESLFAKLDEAKEKAQAVVDGFEDRKAAILHKAFTGELTSIKNADSINYVLSEIHKWSVTFPAKDIKAIEKEQEKASIICLPDGRNWIKCTVGAIGRVTNGSTPSRKCSDYWNGNIPWVSSGEVRNNTIYITNECITQKGFDNSSVKLLPKGTILIAMIGEGKTRGQSAILEIEATINQNIAAIVIDHGLVEPEFLWFWFQMNYKKNREKGSGSGPQALNCQRVRELDCICPSIKEQREIVTLLRALILKEEQVNENAEHVIELIDNIKKSILARAFRGELGTNDPTDESAEKLLKRILI